jgi:hypothetical protein
MVAGVLQALHSQGRGAFQLAVVIGYYRMIAGLAQGFEFPLPPGMSDPFKAPGSAR